MNRSKTLVLSKVSFLFFLFPFLWHADPVQAQDCRSLFADHLNWIKQKPGLSEGSHVVGAKMAKIKIKDRNPDSYPWGYGSYAESRFGLGTDLQGRFKIVFSDRKSPDGKYRFAPDKSDIDDVTLFSDGRVKVNLVTWGNVGLFLEEVKCYRDGFVTGIMREANGVSVVSLALRKEVMHPDRDGFRNWP